MEIKIDFTAQARAAAGTGSATYTVPDSCPLIELLAYSAQRQGAALKSLVFGQDGRIRPSLMIALNDEQVLPGSAPSLKHGDVVALMPPISGG